MRVAYVCADVGVPVFGRKGCSIHVQEVIRALGRLGAQVEVFSPLYEGEPPADLESVRLHRLPEVPLAVRRDIPARERASLALNRPLRTALERAGPFELVYERYSLWSFAGMEHARAVAVPRLLEVNAALIEEQAEHRGLLDRAGAEHIATGVFRDATAILAVSDEVAAYLGRRYPATHGRVHVVPNGVDPDRFAPAARRSTTAGGGFTVGFVGTLKPWHGLAILVEAFDRLHRAAPDTRLLVVGDGPERAGLEADLAARGLREAVQFTGGVDAGEVPALLGRMDVAVAPYPALPHFYFSPLKVYEYMAAGRAVVVSCIGQLAALIEHEVNGLCCPPGDPGALAAALERLRREPGLRARLGRAARATVRRHTWKAVARRILGLAGLECVPQR
ncbi:MAG TPA: glycosyltransferase family 4 protein [Gemmataceae bacterium]|jgi:glycosyltransferase involved in cell wall biosynthesis|nr:glycosyltransferase family 4 protein [Gemmataceae bacterium]